MSAPSNREPVDLEAIRERWALEARVSSPNMAAMLNEIERLRAENAEMKTRLADTMAANSRNIGALAAARRKVERVVDLTADLERHGTIDLSIAQTYRRALADESAAT